MNFHPNLTKDAATGLLDLRFDYHPVLAGVVGTLDSRAIFQNDGNGTRRWLFPCELTVLRRITDLFGISRDRLPNELRDMLGQVLKSPEPSELSKALAATHHFLTPPRDYQKHGLAELVEWKRWGIFWPLGVGKSFLIANRLRLGFMRGEWNRPIIIFCPRAVALPGRSGWQQQLKEHGGLDCVLLLGDKTERRRLLAEALEKSSIPILVTNYETAQIMFAELAKANPQVVVCDEAQKIKNSTSLTSRRVRKISEFSTHRWALSATPSPNGPLDIFGTLLFLNPAVAGTPSKTAFESRYGCKRPLSGRAGDFRRVLVGYQNLDELAAKVASVSSSLDKDKCLGLPPKTFMARECELAGEPLAVYRRIRDEAVATLREKQKEGQLTVPNVLTEVLRLIQIAGGFVPADDGRMFTLEPNAKLALLNEVLDEAQGQVVVWASFRREVEAIAALFKERKEKFVEFHGDLNDKERAAAIETFERGEAKYFVGTPQSGGVGINGLQVAANMIFYSRTYNWLHYEQAIGRIDRFGQKNAMTIVNLIARETIDEKVAAALEQKADLQAMLLASSVEDVL